VTSITYVSEVRQGDHSVVARARTPEGVHTALLRYRNTRAAAALNIPAPARPARALETLML